LKNILGRTNISYETLQTVVTEVEAVMNDRPLTYVSSESSDAEPLTPAHLLYGRRLTTLSYQDVTDTQITNSSGSDITCITRRARVKKLLIDRFREKWGHEYLTTLREHHNTTGNNIQTISAGDVVQIHDENPRSQWKLAVLEKLITGRDGFTRAAKIRTKNGVTNRAIVKLYP
jgi:hypothetical protein